MGTKYIQVMVPVDLAIGEALVLAANGRSQALWRKVFDMRRSGETDAVKIEKACARAKLADLAKDEAIQILDAIKANTVAGAKAVAP